MKFREHEENRQWIIGAIDELQRFITTDADFRANKAHELKAIAIQRRFVEDGRYRVVFLGTFNVGKSTGINAFLGGGYLPMDVEECTSKLTFIQRGERQEIVVNLREPAAAGELEALGRVLADAPAEVSQRNEGKALVITFPEPSPQAMRVSLEPLVTVLADEDFPHLAPLRDKIEELDLFLPANLLQDDISFVDTPGVHSVSETRQEITYSIIDRSHLVIVFVDSGLAGNIHDLNFIKRIIKWRGRKVFFVLNKADKLESDEIDPRGTRGPARSLIEAFGRNEIPEDSEIFFLSGYRALRAQELDNGQLTLDRALDDNKLSVPTSVAERVDESEDPARDLSAYLMGQSRLPHLKERLHDYLLNENKAGRVVGTAAQFVWERADDFVAPLEAELSLARDPAKFDELRKNRDVLLVRLDEIRRSSDRVLDIFNLRSKGGEFNGTRYSGFEAELRESMTDKSIVNHVIQPVMDWLKEGSNLADARKEKFKPLSARLEHQVDEFVSGIMARLTLKIEEAEKEAHDAIVTHLGQVRELRMHLSSPTLPTMAQFDASMASSYVAFGASGAAIGAAAGAAVGSFVPLLGTAIGAGIGGVVGALSGFLTRRAWGVDRWIKKLEPIVRDNAMNILLLGGKDANGHRTAPLLESIIEYLRKRSDSFVGAVREEVDNAITQVQQQIDGLLSREDEIRRESEAIVARLDPKVSALASVRDKAAEIVDTCFNRENLRS